MLFSLARSLSLSPSLLPLLALPHPLSFSYLAILITSQRVSELVFISPCHFWLCGFLSRYHVLSVLFLPFVNDTINYGSRVRVFVHFVELSSPLPNLKEGGLIFDIGMKE